MSKSSKYRLLSILWLTLLFSISGALLYLVVFVWGIWAGEPPFWPMAYSLAVTIVSFNVWGWTSIMVFRRLIVDSGTTLVLRTRSRVFFLLLLLCICSLLFTYLIFVYLRWVGYGRDINPFALSESGLMLLVMFWVVEIVVVCYIMVECFARQTRELYRKKRNLEHNAMKMQYQVLQNQVNPHFLFNNLSVLAAEIESNPRNAVQFVHNFSDIFRYMLQLSDKDLVTLKEELDFFDSYLFLYKTRYRDKIKIDNKVDSSAYGASLPPMTLQLLVENALKHNCMTVESPLRISLELVDDGRQLRFANNIQETRNFQISGRGLVNLSSRYSLICGKSIEVSRTDLEFVVIIPLIYGKTECFGN
ncbi:MAG: sensor histidine kinase [Candidatus Cryptobacteroides sp.]